MTAPGEQLVVGQQVWLYHGYRRDAGPERAQVIKVGRLLATIGRIDDRNGTIWGASKFYMAGGHDNERISGNSWFKTDAKRALDECRGEIEAIFLKAGLRFTASKSPLSLAQLEAIVQIIEGPSESAPS